MSTYIYDAELCKTNANIYLNRANLAKKAVESAKNEKRIKRAKKWFEKWNNQYRLWSQICQAA